MGKDYSASRSLLEKALNSLPDDFALSEVRGKVKSAISKLNEIEKKKGKPQQENQPTLSQKWHNEIQDRVRNIPTASAKDRLAAIEQMMNLEAAKLEQPKKETNEDMGTILG